ncbi:hypothetical protein [Roseivirga sp. UBA1976]|uniref:DinB family protein n=1 Tax=Roseivirga sp. UBA1976 TaxID=1947386 RepID=UPI00257D1DD8|nr:hypothetical protein [Roseivirga sp. UBA1976]MEC7756090.1 hypothetical protein [Bacteroidota bacterium]|tara:strand:+ start:86 stop:634 length:549 start_codon:yes stop_codon:yes gene_type:complete
MKALHTSLFFLFFTALSAQDLPYRSIPDVPEGLYAQQAMARMVDGLGFRFYWASESLRPEDLAFGPEGEGRNVMQTIQHIYGLSVFTMTSLDKTFEAPKAADTYEELRTQTLHLIKAISDKLQRMDNASLQKVEVNGLPFWYLINGPIADAIYHTGQIVLLRRMSGNPTNPKVSVLRGVVGN